VEEGAPYTSLEHQWDEGFGYFGAPRAWPSWELATSAGAAVQDDDQDGRIDLLAEVAWGHSTNAAKRDVGSVVPTDFVGEAWNAFYGGRALLDRADGPLSDAEVADLAEYRDQAVSAWEKAIAASVVHYINHGLVHHEKFGKPEYKFADHAKHWSEMKGFALSLQFNPRSPMADPDFLELHRFIRQGPALLDAAESDRDQARRDLLAARALLGRVYGFDIANLGGEDGRGGW